MVNLHYANIELEYSHEFFIKDVYRTVGDYYSFFNHVSRWMWNPDRLHKATWKKAAFSQISEKNNTQHNNEKQNWVIINSTNEQKHIDVIDKFCEAPFLIEHPDRRSQWIRILDADANRGLLLLDKMPEPETEFLYLPPNEYVINQQRRSLLKLRDNPEPENRGLLRLFEETRRADWPPLSPVQCNNWEFLTDNSIEGTDEQRDFVKKALGTPDFAILEGPPGSGKTTTICEIIIQEIKKGHRILLCASTHVAVDNVLEALQEHGSTSDIVLAVRIGNKRNISETVQDFQLENRENKERKDLIQKLMKLTNPSESQQYLLDALQNSKDKEGIITRLILESANLVCGTTIGILQHPDIRSQKDRNQDKESKGNMVVAPFDCLILDEASKTTFQEFLVPALFCRKWILVGDVHQLSPYVETTHIEDNIRSLIDSEEDALVCNNVFQSWYRSRYSTQGLLIVDPDEPEKYRLQAESLGLNFLDLSMIKNIPNCWDLYSAHIILANKDNLNQIGSFLPPDFLISPYNSITQQILRRYNYWLVHHNKSKPNDKTLDENSLWAKNLAWRINRSFERRDDVKGSEKYDSEIHALLPQWFDDNESHALHRMLDTIKRITLPSILELIQNGFGRGERYLRGSSITDGMHPDDFSQRHTKLSYQHRMHPEISRFPRDFIYNSQSLQDPKGITSKRSWGYNAYSHRAGWIQTVDLQRDSNVNIKEANIVIRELEKFTQWANNNPKKTDKPWEVAILTFYLDQERYLRQRIQRMTGTNYRSYFTSKDGSTKIRLCTVDRFQGHEADLVILSFVRNRSIGFLDSSTRLNVAITRARFQLLLIGNRRRFANQRQDNQLKSLAENVPVLSLAWPGRSKK